MWVRVLVLLLVGVRLATAAPATPIVGGTPEAPDEFPTVVAIEIGSAFCTGTVIAPGWVLTAAHCVWPAVVGADNQQQVTSSIRVHVGTVDLTASTGTIVAAVDSVPDPLFDPVIVGQHDAGLIELASPVAAGQLVPLNFDPEQASVGVGVTMVGFGATQVGGTFGIAYVAQQTSEPCPATSGSDANLLCFDQTTGSGACDGDSGGPSFATVAAGLLQVGIASFGDHACSSFSAATRVDVELGFLAKHVLGLPCVADSNCPEGGECADAVCALPPAHHGGCDAARSHPSFGLVVAAVMLGCRRRARSARPRNEAGCASRG